MKKKNISKRVEEGIARNVKWERVVQSSNDRTDILSFTIEQTDHQGNPVRYISVYCKSNEIKGVLVDGDPVRVSGQMSEGGTLLPEEIFNIRTQASIEFTSEQDSQKGCLQLILILLSIITLIAIISFMSSPNILDFIAIQILFITIFINYRNFIKKYEEYQ